MNGIGMKGLYRARTENAYFSQRSFDLIQLLITHVLEISTLNFRAERRVNLLDRNGPEGRFLDEAWHLD